MPDAGSQFADHLGGSVAEPAFAGGVERSHHAGGVRGDDGVIGRAQDAVLQPQGFGELLIEVALGLLYLFAFSDVLAHHYKALVPPVFVADGGDADDGKKTRAIIAHAPAFVFKMSLVQRLGQCLFRQAGGQRFQRIKNGEMPTDDFVSLITFGAFRTGIPTGHPAFRVEHKNGVILHAVHHQAETFLARAQGRVGQRQFRRALGDNRERPAVDGLQHDHQARQQKRDQRGANRRP